MYGRPRYTQSDKNQKRIVRELRGLGFHVGITSHLAVRYGVLDIFVCGVDRHLDAWVCYPFEVKRPDKEDDLNANEEELIATLGQPDLVATSADDVLKKFGWID